LTLLTIELLSLAFSSAWFSYHLTFLLTNPLSL
jgi:hypothetical protein